FEILQTFTPYQLMPIQTLKKKVLGKIDELSKEIENSSLAELMPELAKMKSTMEKVEEATEEDIEGLTSNIDTFGNEIEINSEENERLLLGKILKQIKELIVVFKNRTAVQNSLSSLKEEFRSLYGLENIRGSLNELFSEFLDFEELTLDTISVKDEDFIKQLSIGIGNFSVLKHGSGYQSLSSLILKLFKSIYQIIKREDVEFRSFIIAIEEPEAHLHPHLQRHFIKALKTIQAKLLDEGISTQFLLSTHSPFILSPLSVDNITFLRPRKSISPHAVKIDKNKFAQEIVDGLYLTDPNSKAKKKKQITLWLERLFFDFPEIFFSKCIIIGEGETEQGAIPKLGEKIGKNLDQFGISFLNGEGDSLIYPVKLLSVIKTSCVLIIDEDKKSMLESCKSIPEDCIFVTESKAFESEILSTSPLNKILQALDAKSIPKRNRDRIAHLKGHFHSLKGKEIESLKDVLFYLTEEDLKEFKEIFVLDWMKDEKGLSFGRILAELLDKDEIPRVFVNAIEKAVELSRKNLP
ncbi:MAG: ATP-dependent nuclease, partial [Candidatus Heimdallarchaeaceae archaeon]